jgi:hypothetical protein
MKARDNQLTAASTTKHLRQVYPQETCPWIWHFLKLANHLPRRRYLASASNDADFAVRNDTDGVSSCKVTEPEYWSVSEITVRVLQEMLLAQTKIKFPLREIRKLLKWHMASAR